MAARGLGLGRAFDDVSLDVRAGEVLGIYGFMGCGQLELARTLFGKIKPNGGTLSIDGKTMRFRNTAEARRAGIAFVPESRRAMLFYQEPVYKNMSISMLERISRLWLKPAVERNDRAPACRGAAHPAADGRCCSAEPVRRQPAEGGAGQVADLAAAKCWC